MIECRAHGAIRDAGVVLGRLQACRCSSAHGHMVCRRHNGARVCNCSEFQAARFIQSRCSSLGEGRVTSPTCERGPGTAHRTARCLTVKSSDKPSQLLHEGHRCSYLLGRCKSISQNAPQLLSERSDLITFWHGQSAAAFESEQRGPPRSCKDARQLIPRHTSAYTSEGIAHTTLYSAQCTSRNKAHVPEMIDRRNSGNGTTARCIAK